MPKYSLIRYMDPEGRGSSTRITFNAAISACEKRREWVWAFVPWWFWLREAWVLPTLPGVKALIKVLGFRVVGF